MPGGNLPFGLAPSGALTAYQPTLRERATDWLRTKLFSDDRAGQGRAEKVMDVAQFTPFGFGVDMYDAGREAGMGNYGGAAMALGMAGAPGPSPKGIRAYHGSPHDFDRFDMSKIGTGEGAQAYGHGLYFAENEGVARGYRDRLKQPGNIRPDAEAIRQIQKRWDEIVAELRTARAPDGRPTPRSMELQNELDALSDHAIADTLARKPHLKDGRMYEVEINADPNAFLDWDKPLSEQPQNVRDALARIDAEVWSPGGGDYDPTESGQMAYHRLIAGYNPNYQTSMSGKEKPAVSSWLNQEGIPGIKYLDAGSRPPTYGPYVQDMLNQFGSKEKALEVAKQRLASAQSVREQIKAQEAVDALSIPETRNYVVFDDKLISIVKKYGIAGASAILGYNVLQGMDPAQAAELKQIEGNQ
jgi:hypothetical protein